ncbi:unnamed protein product [Closterium sp. Yama58-4]|nr:unnamed protein product [Closterium sp. Yama58-4]
MSVSAFVSSSASAAAFLHDQASSNISPPRSVNNSPSVNVPSTSVHSSTDHSAFANDNHSVNTNHATFANANTNTNTGNFASFGQISSSSSCRVESASHGGYPSATSASRPTASHHMALISAAPPIRFGAEGAPIDFPVLCLGFVACSITAALSVMLVAAVPALLAIRKAAQALERLAEVAREEVPGTMAAVRLSGMEMSDLSMELSDLSQEISQGIRNSARAVRLAEDGLRRVGSLAASRTAAIIEERAVVPVPSVTPVIASAARSTKNAIRGARDVVSQVSLISHLSNFLPWADNQPNRR